MSRIYVNFDGLQDLEIKMYGILDQLSNLQQEIAGAMNRLDWEVSQKRSIDEQISQARRRAARLAHRSEHMLRFVKRASADFMKTDLRCANDLRNLNGYLDCVWKGFLGFGSRLFNDIGSCGMDLISALRQAGFYFVGRVTEFQSAHLGHINTAVAVTSLGVAPLGSYELNGVLKERFRKIRCKQVQTIKQFAEDNDLSWVVPELKESVSKGISSVPEAICENKQAFKNLGTTIYQVHKPPGFSILEKYLGIEVSSGDPEFDKAWEQTERASLVSPPLTFEGLIKDYFTGLDWFKELINKPKE